MPVERHCPESGLLLSVYTISDRIALFYAAKGV